MESDRLIARCPEEFFAKKDNFNLRILCREAEVVGYRYRLETDRAIFNAHSIQSSSLIEGDPGLDWVYFSIRQAADSTILVNRSGISRGTFAISILAQGGAIAAVSSGYRSYCVGIRRDFLEEQEDLPQEHLRLLERTAAFRISKALFEKMNHELGLLQFANQTDLDFELQIADMFGTLLACIDNSQEIGATNRHRIVSTSIEFIKNHPGKKISPLELAEACHCAPRTLQYAFRKTFGISPKKYIDRFRLSQFRAELLESGQDCKQKIHDLAKIHGFGHAGNLSRMYRELFGRLPSDGCACEFHDHE